MGYLQGLKKYDAKGPFNDPVLRCDSCQKLNLRTQLGRLGMCAGCGNKRMRSIQLFTEVEQVEMRELQVDPDFLALFAAKEER